jgi:PAS domain S-box-containing protein
MSIPPALFKFFELDAGSPVACIMTDSEHKVRMWNAAAARLWKVSSEEALDRPLAEILTFVEHELSCEEVLREAFTQARYRGEIQVTSTAGRRIWVDWTSWPMPTPNGYREGITTAAVDITGRKETEGALRESEGLYRSLVHASPDAILLVDLEGHLITANERTARIAGIEDSQELSTYVDTIFDVVVEEDRARARDQFQRTIACDRSGPHEYTIRKLDGTMLPVDVSASIVLDENGQPKAVIGVIRDLSDKRQMELERARLESELSRQQKLESIGTLAAGVAHEINNPVNVVMNYASLVRKQAPEDSPIKDYSSEILRECERISSITRSLLTFARQAPDDPCPTALFDVLEETNELVRRMLAKDRIALQMEIPADLPLVECRPGQMQQVFMNLVTNARDGLNERFPSGHDEKVITVSARVLEDNEGRWIRLTVEDRGTGVPADMLERIFDPFFTTKSVGRGTGLGLAVSHGIAQDHGGRLSAESKVDDRTRFHLDLPLRTDDQR